MANLETRLGDAVVAALKANAVFVALIGTNVEFQLVQGALTDEKLQPGQGVCEPQAPDPLSEDGDYDDSRRSEYGFAVRLRLGVDPTKGGVPEQTQFYHALNEVFGNPQTFMATVSDPEGNLLVKDGDVEIQPAPPQADEPQDGVLLEADILIRVWHKKVMTQ